MSRWLPSLTLVGLCLVAFVWGLPAPLTHYDDNLYISDNLAVMSTPGWAGLAQVWSASRAFSGQFVEYFPLRDTVYWLIFQHWGTEGLPYHVVNLGFHVVASLLALRLARTLGLTDGAAWLVAALFAVHPAHVESVEWAAGLKDPMYTSLMFAALLCFARVRAGGSWVWQVGVLAWLTLSLLVKSMAISAPLLMLAMERLGPAPVTPWRTVVARLAAPVLLCGFFLSRFMAIAKANQVLVLPHGGSWASHVVLALWAQAKYLQAAVMPSGFRLVYCFEPVQGLSDWRLWVALAVLLTLAVVVFRFRRAPLLGFSVLWYVACLAPVSNVIPFPAVMADRYLYAAVFGVAVLAAQVLQLLRPSLQRVVAGALVLVSLMVSAQRAVEWLDEDNLWADADEDPACLTDPSEQAALAHMTRHWTTHDPDIGYQALQRAIASPGFTTVPHQFFCIGTATFTHTAAEHGEPEKAAQTVQWAEQYCADKPDTWAATMDFALHRDLPRAARAAERLEAMVHSPHAQVMRALTKLEAGDSSELDRVTAATGSHPMQTCPAVRQWVARVPAHQSALAPALANCPN